MNSYIIDVVWWVFWIGLVFPVCFFHSVLSTQKQINWRNQTTGLTTRMVSAEPDGVILTLKKNNTKIEQNLKFYWYLIYIVYFSLVFNYYLLMTHRFLCFFSIFWNPVIFFCGQTQKFRYRSFQCLPTLLLQRHPQLVAQCYCCC